jgi:hypothetical protein
MMGILNLSKIFAEGNLSVNEEVWRDLKNYELRIMNYSLLNLWISSLFE